MYKKRSKHKHENNIKKKTAAMDDFYSIPHGNETASSWKKAS